MYSINIEKKMQSYNFRKPLWKMNEWYYKVLEENRYRKECFSSVLIIGGFE
jgi:hypothetical protein